MDNQISPRFFVALFTKTVNEKKFWQKECKKLRSKAAGLSMIINELKSSLDEEVGFRMNVEKEIKVLKQQVLKMKLNRQNSNLIKRMDLRSKLNQLIKNSNRNLAEDLNELKKEKNKSVLGMLGLDKSTSDKEEIKKLKIDKNMLLLELESLTLQNSLQKKNIIQLEMQLNQADISTNRSPSKGSPSPPSPFKRSPSSPPPSPSSSPSDYEDEEEYDSNVDMSLPVTTSNNNSNCNLCSQKNEVQTELSMEVAEVFDRALSEKQETKPGDVAKEDELEEFDPLLTCPTGVLI